MTPGQPGTDCHRNRIELQDELGEKYCKREETERMLIAVLWDSDAALWRKIELAEETLDLYHEIRQLEQRIRRLYVKPDQHPESQGVRNQTA